MKPAILRAFNNYDTDKASLDTALECKDKTLTKQSFKDECDINTIIHRFGLDGQLPTDVRQPQFGDFTGITDFHTAANAIAAANESFDQMPAHVRTRFNNDPGSFVDFCLNPDNKDEAIKLGLVEKPLPPAPVPAPLRVEVVPAAAPAAATTDNK